MTRHQVEPPTMSELQDRLRHIQALLLQFPRNAQLRQAHAMAQENLRRREALDNERLRLQWMRQQMTGL